MAFNYSPKIVTDGIVLYLDAANSKSYAGTGTTWRDLTRNGNNGTLTNGPTFSSTNGGNIVFDGTDDYVIGPILNLSVYTLCIMVRVMTITVGGGIMGGNGGNVYIQMGGSGVWQFEFAFTNYTPTVNQWTYVCGVQNASSQQFLYLNGSLVANSFSFGPKTSNLGTNFLIGRREIGPVYSNINVGSAQIYNRVLSDQEIQQNFNAIRGRFGI